MLGLYTAAIYRLALPFVRLRISPNTVSLFGVVLAASVPALARVGGRSILLAALLCLLSGLTDGVDGAVAALTRRATPLGAVVDAVCDRAADFCLVGAMTLLHGPAWLGVGAAAAIFALEYTRARAAGAGMQQVGVVTVAERPTRVIVAMMCCGYYGVNPGGGAWVSTICLTALLVLTIIGFIQLWWWLIRHLR